jgi:integrase
MRGTVTKKGGKWYVVVERPTDPLTGKRRPKWHSGFKTKKEAERARIDLLSKLDRGEYVEPSQQTLADYLVEWLIAIEHTVRPSTFDSYKRNMHNHVIAHIGSTTLSRVDAVTLNGLYGMLLSSGRRRPSQTGRGYSPEIVDRAIELRCLEFSLTETAEILQTEFEEAAALNKNTLNSLLRRRAERSCTVIEDQPSGLDRRTVNYIHTILHRALKDAVRWNRLARNPADAADPPRGAAKSDGVHAWDAATLRSFLGTSRESGDRMRALWVLLATTGMRRGEALGVRWSDVDLDAGRLRVVQTITQVRSKVSVGEPKTSSGRRSIALDDGSVAVLRSHRKLMLEERLLVGPDFSDSGLVFHYPDGSCLRPDAVSAQFLRRVERQRLPRLTLHGLRHTWATLALEQGIHPRVVQERLGHSTIAITLGIYSHVSPTLHDEAASIVASMLAISGETT